eukprot:1489971-Amphidinium_carterae.2
MSLTLVLVVNVVEGVLDVVEEVCARCCGSVCARSARGGCACATRVEAKLIAVTLLSAAT